MNQTSRRLAIAAVLAASLATATVPAAAFEPTPAPEGVELYFVTPVDGATVTSPVRVVFGLRGMGVAPAGADMPNTGHHHLVINRDVPPAGRAIPADESHRHFGGGQTEADIELPPGTHVLRLVLGDHRHIPHEPPVVSAPITITVE